jgi:RNA polymerase sigma factor (sigma-70 family)
MYVHPEIRNHLAPQREAVLRSQYSHRRRRPRQTGSTPFDDLGPLVRAAQAGDEQAWELLLTRLTPRLRGVVRGYGLGPADVDDVVQATWASAFASIDRLRNPDAFGGWLVVTARHESLRVIKRSRREIAVDDEHLLDQVTDRTPESALLETEERDAVHAAIERLPDRQRIIVRALLRHSGASYVKIADNLGIPLGSIGPTRERALARLRTDGQLTTAI